MPLTLEEKTQLIADVTPLIFLLLFFSFNDIMFP